MTVSSDQSLNTNQLPLSLDIDSNDKDSQSIIISYLRRVAQAVNTKESGLFLLQETGSFEQWFGATPQNNRSGYRLTVDLVALNLQINVSATIPAGTTNNLTLSAVPATQPVPPIGYLYPVHGFGGALDTAGVSYFPSDPSITISYNGSTNTFTIINNTGNALTWCVFVIEYLKN